MKAASPRFLILLTCAIVAVFLVALTVGHPRDCGQTARGSLPAVVSHDAAAPEPTPAPSQGLVFLRVECDRPDIEASWAPGETARMP